MKNNKNKFSFKYLLKHLIIALLFLNGLIIVMKDGYNFVSISNSMAIIGIVYLILGLFRIVMRLGFFNLFVFGFKKTYELIITRNYSKRESKVGEYSDYLNNTTYENPYLELLLLSVVFIILSMVFANLS